MPAPRRKPAVPTDAPGELRQLAAIRARFAAVPPALGTALMAQHSADACRDRGGSTRARDTFRGAILWARSLGEPAHDAVLQPQLVRWFLDCLTALGAALDGHTVPTADPSAAAAFDDAVHHAEDLLRRAKRRLEAAVGSNPAWRTALDAATVGDGLDPRVVQLNALVALITRWLAPGATVAPPLGAYGVDTALATRLHDAAVALDHALASRPAPRPLSHNDDAALNELEGRVYFAMRSLWDELAEARADGRTALTLPTPPALQRGLHLNARNRRHAAGQAASPSMPGAPTSMPGR